MAFRHCGTLARPALGMYRMCMTLSEFWLAGECPLPSELGCRNTVPEYAPFTTMQLLKICSNHCPAAA